MTVFFSSTKVLQNSKQVITKWTLAKFDKKCNKASKNKDKNDHVQIKVPIIDYRLSKVLINTFYICYWLKVPVICGKAEENKRKTWPHPTKSGSLRCCFILMTTPMHKKLRYQLIYSRYIADQRILISDWIRDKPDHISNQKWCFQMIPSFDNYLLSKNIRYWLIPSREIDDWSDWVWVFNAITEEPHFPWFVFFTEL